MSQVQNQPQVAISSPNGGLVGIPAGQFEITSLYVGDLDANVTDSPLYDLFVSRVSWFLFELEGI